MDAYAMNRGTLRSNIADTLTVPGTPYFPLVNDALAFATLVSIIAAVSETFPFFESYIPAFLFIEWFTVGLFTLEYLLRAWTAERLRDYVVSPIGLIDLAAVLPTFLGLGTFTFLKAARMAKTLRLMRVVGRANLSRVKHTSDSILEKLDRSGSGIMILLGICTALSIGTLGMLGVFTPSFFLMTEVEPGLTYIETSVLLFGKVCWLLFLGFIAGMLGSFISRRCIHNLPNTFILFDTEYTAWEGSQARKWTGPGEHRELVQIGAVKVDSKLSIVGTFDVLVRPSINPTLSDYFITLTGINQRMIETKGLPPHEALQRFHAWCGSLPAYSFGNDGKVIAENYELCGARNPFKKNQFKDIRDHFKAHGITTEGYMSSTIVRAFGLEPTREGHNALSDARTILDALRALHLGDSLSTRRIDVV